MPGENENQEEKNKGISEEDVGKIVNAAVTNQLNRALPKAIGEAIPKAMTEALKGVDWGGVVGGIVEEKIKGLEPPKNDGETSKPDPKITTLEQQIKALAERAEASDKRATAAEEARAAAETQRLRDAGIAAFRSAVSTKVNPAMLDVFVEYFAGKKLTLDEKGNPVLAIRKAQYKGGPEEEVNVSLEEGVTHLLASKEVFPFLPAPGGQRESGNGRKAPTVPGSGGSADPAARTAQQLAEHGLNVSDLL